jgi:hypothetical protein
MKNARDFYGFQSFVVYESPIKLNVCDVEDALQRYFQSDMGLPIGRRFWRQIAKGNKKHEENKHFKTFITFSKTIGAHYSTSVKVQL